MLHMYLLTVDLFLDNAPREHVYFCFGPVFQTAAKRRFIARILAPSPMALCHFGAVHRLAAGFNVIESDTKNVPSVSVCAFRLFAIVAVRFREVVAGNGPGLGGFRSRLITRFCVVLFRGFCCRVMVQGR